MQRILAKPDPTGNLQLTDRDILWLRAVYRFRFITTDQAQLMARARSRNKVNERLRELYAHNYLDRPDVQRAVYAFRDKRHVVHALGQRGAAFLADHDGITFPAGKGWAFANQLKSAERLEHQIGVVDTMLHFERTVEPVAGLRVIHADELMAIAPDWPSRLKPHRLPTQVRNKEGVLAERGTDPDYTFALGQTGNEKERRALFFLEWDNSTESYVKRDQLASSIAQKYHCYTDVYRRKLHSTLYGFKNFRVLFVVNDTADRIRKMQHVFERRVNGQAPDGIFLYTTMSELEALGPLAEIWETANGKRCSLV